MIDLEEHLRKTHTSSEGVTYSIGNGEGNRKKGITSQNSQKKEKLHYNGTIIRFGTVHRIDLRCMPEKDIPRDGGNMLGERKLKICNSIVYNLIVEL